MVEHGGNIQPSLDLEEHEHDAIAKRVLLRAFDGSDYTTLASEEYDGGSKDGLAVVLIDGATGTFAILGEGSEMTSTLVTSAFFTVGTSTIGGPEESGDRKKIFFRASPSNVDSVFLHAASSATSINSIELEPGDVFSDSRPFAYTGTYWLQAGDDDQTVFVRQWL